MTHSRKSLGFALLSFVTFLVIAVITAVAPGNEIFTAIGGILLIVFIVFGFSHALRSIKEPNNASKILGLIANGLLFLVFAVLVIANVIDIVKAFG
ncbi:MAG: hypothetical protein EOO50_16055 [Flavobacterium sp.]|uniref:hypothetical protein n=1 Tax=Flavobacterium sp. TaxID=239 RepID=UPI0012010F21|nr:hypothetical protein [Flavobacterium sp.]RZJ64313.1 MAG: hypothetical protein EOO50_16055 [Flavobacterium sp.]